MLRFLKSEFLCLCLAWPAASPAQDEAPKPDSAAAATSVALDSPQSTMRTFLIAIRPAVKNNDKFSWEEVLSCLDLSRANKDRAQMIAEQLRGVIDRLEYINWDTTPLPDADEVKARNLSSYTYFPAPRFTEIVRKVRPKHRIVLSKSESGHWLFSAQTVVDVYDLYRSLEELKRVKELPDISERSLSLWLRDKIPWSLKGSDHEFLTLEHWQWIGLFIIILTGLVLDYSVRFALRNVSARLIARQGAREHAKAVRLAVRPLGFLAAAILWVIALRVLALPNQALTVLLGAARIFGILAGVWAAFRVVDLVGDVLIEKAAATETKLDDVLVPLIRKTLKIFTIALGLIYCADSLDLRIMPLLASLGIGGVAFAFAAKDTVENFFGSVAVLLDRPFEVGDWVVIGSTEGTVEEVGFRSTRIRTFYNSQVTVPNANLVRAQVDNYGRRQYRRWKTYVGVQYDTPPDKLVEFVEGIRELVRTHPHTRKDYYHVYYNRFGPSSLDILVYVFHEVPDWGTELRERERLFLDIVRLADKVGVQFAFPTQTVHLATGASTPHITIDTQAAGPPSAGAPRAYT